MRKQFATQDLVILGVSLDEEAKDAKVQQSVRNVLAKRGVTFPNVILDEDQTFWQEKLRFAGPPAMYVFNRDGRWKAFTDLDEEKAYKEIDKLVEEWLGRK